MDQVTRWLRAAAQPAVVRRALLTSILVGSVLVLINHAAALVNSGLSAGDVVPIALTYAVPYVVSTASSIAAARGQARLLESEHESRDRAIESLSQVPGQNPNPVLRLTGSGRLVYANASSAPLRVALGIEVGGDLPMDLVEELRTAARESPPRAVEHTAGIRTFSWLPIEVPDLDLINLYGTDITAEKVVERFPGRNPNPVMRMSYDGRLIYANEASGPIAQALGIVGGGRFPAEIADRATDWLAGQDQESFEHRTADGAIPTSRAISETFVSETVQVDPSSMSMARLDVAPRGTHWLSVREGKVDGLRRARRRVRWRTTPCEWIERAADTREGHKRHEDQKTGGSATTTRFRPRCLARYRALSAAPSRIVRSTP